MIHDSGTPRDRDPNREAGFRVGVSERASSERPDRIEDDHFIEAERGTFGVFDGMSKPKGSERAAREARTVIKSRLSNVPDTIAVEQAQRLLVMSFTEAHHNIHGIAALHPELRGIGTTATAVKFLRRNEGGRIAVIGNVGDSRAYVIKTDGTLEQITIDDNVALENTADEQEARDLQAMFNDLVDPTTLDEAQRQRFNKRNSITNALGSYEWTTPNPRIYPVEVAAGERLVLLTDGVSDNLTDREIERILQDHINPDEAATALVDAARERSKDKDHPRAKQDDMTAMVIEIPE